MNTIIGSGALMLGILYVLSRWALSTVELATAHPGKGRPDITWRVTWYLALIVSALGALSVHVWLLAEALPGGRVLAFNALIFGGFFIGFFVAGHFDHKVRLGLRSGGD